MPSNKYTGDVELEIAGQIKTMRFDWRAISDARSVLDTDITKTDFRLLELPVLSHVAAAGLKRHHPELTADVIMELSPPVYLLCYAIDVALAFAYMGAGGQEAAEEAAAAEKVVQKPTKKKTREARPTPIYIYEFSFLCVYIIT